MNNKRLEPKSDPRYTIREEILPGGVVSDLSIRRTERSDSALFTCVATNAFGSDDTSINMIIQGNTLVILKSICITIHKTAYKYTIVIPCTRNITAIIFFSYRGTRSSLRIKSTRQIWKDCSTFLGCTIRR